MVSENTTDGAPRGATEIAADAGTDGGEASSPPEMTLNKALLLLALQAAGMIAFSLVLWDLSRRPIAEFVTISGPQILQGLALGLVLSGVAHMLFRAFPRQSEALVRMQAKTYSFLGPRLGWPAIVLISLCAGVGEEALFRGGAQTLLGDYLGPAAAIAIVSAVFALVHMGKPVITALLLVIGLIFGTIYALTGSLLTVMIGHALYDMWALRHLHNEFLRLGIVGAQPEALANPAHPG